MSKNIPQERKNTMHGVINDSDQWKMLALLEINEKGEYVLPFSRRIIKIGRPLWLRSNLTSTPISYEKCPCITCQYKTYRDHILLDDDNDDLSREKANIESDDESKSKENEQDEDNVDKSECEFSSSTSVDSSDVFMSSSISYSPFPCDPYESYDWEC